MQPVSCGMRGYAFGLLRWWRWLGVVDAGWNRAASVEARDFVLWLWAAEKPRRPARTHSAATARTTNSITGKTYLGGSADRERSLRHGQALGE